MKALIIDRIKELELVRFGEFTLKSGIKSNTYFDLRSIVSYPELMADVSLMISRLVPKELKAMVCGVPIGGLPFATMVSQLLGMGMIILRDAKKDHGLQKLVEGRVLTQEVVLIEDVITTGMSTLKAIGDLENEGLKVVRVITILDRKAGGVDLIRSKGYQIEVLLTMDDFTTPTGDYFMSGPNLHPLNLRLREIVRSKDTNIVASLDLSTPREILNMAKDIGDYVCAIKIHTDIVDYSGDDGSFYLSLHTLAVEKNFLIIDDRKYGDIPFISAQQYDQNNIGHMVTVHSLPGEELLAEFQKRDIAVLLVHTLSTQGSLTDVMYSAKVKEMATRYSNVVGFISQKRVLPRYLTFTPGVSLTCITDGNGQTYRSTVQDTDIIIVGRGIYESDNHIAAAKKYKEHFTRELEPVITLISHNIGGEPHMEMTIH